jgi:DNA invertase Pin-like site-specific DNA recombinase
MENVASYVRVSGMGQVDKEGPDRQRQDIAAFCSRHGLNHTGEYFECITGTADTLERPKFMQMVNEIVRRREIAAELTHFQQPKALIISAIVVESCDRLARTVMVQEAAIVQLRKAGIKLYVCKNGTLLDYAADSGDHYLNMQRQMLGVLAEFEKANSCHRLRRARLNKRAKTGRCEGRKPYGFRPGEDTILATIKDWKVKGHTPEQIACSLNANNIKTRYGKLWTAENLRSLLRDRSRIRPISQIMKDAAH